MPLSRPMPSIAIEAEELRIQDRAGIYRVFLLFKAGTRRVGVSCVRKKDPQNPKE